MGCDYPEHHGSGSAFPWLLAGAVAVVAAVAAFVLTHVLILGAALAAFVGGMGGLCVWFRRITQFRPVRREAIKHTLIPARPVTAGPKAIEAAKVQVAPVTVKVAGERMPGWPSPCRERPRLGRSIPTGG